MPAICFVPSTWTTLPRDAVRREYTAVCHAYVLRLPRPYARIFTGDSVFHAAYSYYDSQALCPQTAALRVKCRIFNAPQYIAAPLFLFLGGHIPDLSIKPSVLHIWQTEYANAYATVATTDGREGA